jgi:hypothetical protein
MDINELSLIQQEAASYYKTIDVLQRENRALREEVNHLKELLTYTAPLVSKDVKIEVPKEQAACEIQLRMLHDKSQSRELTLEETKRLEILIKSLYLIKEKATGITIEDSRETSIEDLTKAATSVE